MHLQNLHQQLSRNLVTNILSLFDIFRLNLLMRLTLGSQDLSLTSSYGRTDRRSDDLVHVSLPVSLKYCTIVVFFTYRTNSLLQISTTSNAQTFSLVYLQGPHPTQCATGPESVPSKWHVNPSNGLSRVHECDRRQTDRQTDNATEKCVAISGIFRDTRNDST